VHRASSGTVMIMSDQSRSNRAAPQETPRGGSCCRQPLSERCPLTQVRRARATLAALADSSAATEAATAALECADGALHAVCATQPAVVHGDRPIGDDPLREALAAARAAVTAAAYAVIEADDHRRMPAVT
jgi:hypothetical protein